MSTNRVSPISASMSSVFALRSKWSQLTRLQRATELAALKQATHYSNRRLARELGISEKQVRDLLLIATVPAGQRQGLGRKKLLKAVRASRAQAHETATAMAGMNWQQAAADLAREIKAFVEQELTAKCLWEQFFRELEGGPWAMSEFRDRAPQPQQVVGIRQAAFAIANTQPSDFVSAVQVDDGPEIINQLVSWTAAWTQRVVPDLDMITDAITIARTQLVPQM